MASPHLWIFSLVLLFPVAIAQYEAMELAGLSPRYYLGMTPQLAKRSGVCPAGSHSCLDVGLAGVGNCCLNTQYCIVDTNFKAQCCDIGSLCSGSSPCDSVAYACPSSTSISGSLSTTVSCCARACPSTSAFLCASSLGGGCCSYGSMCATGTVCVSTVAPTTTAASSLASGLTSGCTTSQIACASSLGGGCCNSGYTCTVSSNTNYCASSTGSVAAVRTGPDGILATSGSNTSGKGLTSGAKAGIGAGVAIVALAALGGLAWFCVGKRRQKAVQEPEMSESGQAVSQDGSKATRVTRPSTRTFSSDYFGPTAGHGPFTEQQSSSHTNRGTNRGVPLAPQSPGDISVPVEIYSNEHSNVTTPGNQEHLKGSRVTTEPIELP